MSFAFLPPVDCNLAARVEGEMFDYGVDVDISGGVSMGNTFADFYHYSKKPANMKLALGVRPRDFMELFLERMEKLASLMPKIEA